MSPRPDRAGAAAERRFHLEPGAPRAAEGELLRLERGDAEHARLVLRVRAGDRCIALDGAGGAWPLVVERVERGLVEGRVSGPATREAAPGEPGASLPWIEVAVALPRGSAADFLVDGVTQLGAAALTPLLVERTSPEARSEAPGRRERLARIAREACKQSGRLWNLHLGPALDLEALAARGPATWVRGDPRGAGGDPRLLARREFTRSEPLILAVGPEGGFTAAEEARLAALGALPLRLGPHVLRTETAALAGMAVLGAHLGGT